VFHLGPPDFPHDAYHCPADAQAYFIDNVWPQSPGAFGAAKSKPMNAATGNPALSNSSSEPLAPGMMKRSSLRVRFQEMVQNMQQGQHMLLVAAELGLPNILDNHVTDSFAAMVAGQ
jgi:hypothetical protein